MSMEGGPEGVGDKGGRKTCQEAIGIGQRERRACQGQSGRRGRERGSPAFDTHMT